MHERVETSKQTGECTNKQTNKWHDQTHGHSVRGSLSQIALLPDTHSCSWVFALSKKMADLFASDSDCIKLNKRANNVDRKVNNGEYYTFGVENNAATAT
jgi:hypothetical protein